MDTLAPLRTTHSSSTNAGHQPTQVSQSDAKKFNVLKMNNGVLSVVESSDHTTIRQSLRDVKEKVENIRELLTKENGLVREQLDKGIQSIAKLREHIQFLHTKVERHVQNIAVVGKIYNFCLKILGFFGIGIYSQIKKVHDELNKLKQIGGEKQAKIWIEDALLLAKNYTSDELDRVSVQEELYALKKAAEIFNIQTTIYLCIPIRSENILELYSLKTEKDATPLKKVICQNSNSGKYTATIEGQSPTVYDTIQALLDKEIEDTSTSFIHLQALKKVFVRDKNDKPEIQIFQIDDTSNFNTLQAAQQSLIDLSKANNQMYHMFCISSESGNCTLLYSMRNLFGATTVLKVSVAISNEHEGKIKIGSDIIDITRLRDYIKSKEAIYGQPVILNQETGKLSAVTL